MKAYIVHLFTVCGGGERVSLEIARVLKERGFSVTYVTNSRTGLEKCAELFKVPAEYDVVEVSSIAEKLLSITGRFVRYRRLLLMTKAYNRVLKYAGGDLIVDTGTNGAFSVDIAYIHYPVVLGTVESNALHWRLYNWLVARKARSVMGKPRIALANSSWTAKLVKEVYGIEALVLHPPVDVEYFAYDGRPKEKTIVTISRLTPEKNLHLIPRVASEFPDYEWYLVGSTGMDPIERRASLVVMNKVLAEKERWKARNFHVLTNLPRKDLRELLQRASFYVHPEFPEHFGIAVVEAMAAGAVPLVYRDGGAWTDIVSKLDPALGYSSINEVPSIIRSIESGGRLGELSREATTQAQSFSTEAFRRRFLAVVEEYLEKR